MNNKYQQDFSGKRIWMYWPDKKACQFNENVKEGFMACGLPEDREVGDLDQIMDVKGGLDAALISEYGSPGSIGNGRKLLTEFANVMDIGDFILARREFDHIIGVGIVSGDYQYREARPRFRHCRKVQWIATGQWPFAEEFKHGTKWNRVTMITGRYRKIAEQLITWICDGEDVDEKKLQQFAEEKKTTKVKSTSSTVDAHAAFVSAARHYQETLVRQWAKELGDVCIWDERPRHEVWLKEEYALQGLVFYQGFRQEIMRLYREGKTKIGLNLLNNALRSEHIPYNLFFPMMKDSNKEATKDFFNELLGTDVIAEVLKVRIEYAPQPKENYLNDGTSFDTFVLYRHIDGSKGAIGIEVKYTEREYHIGDIEYKNTHDDDGNVRLSWHYSRATQQSGYYLTGSEAALVSDNLRQIWRNHILGASMVLKGDIGHFSSMTIFPDANPHFHMAAAAYRKVLTEKGRKTFLTFTYEKLFEVLAHHFCTSEHQAWIEYLYHRYLFDGAERVPEEDAMQNNYSVKSLNRGVTASLIDAFKHSPVYMLYSQHPDELLIGVRNNYLNVYYLLNNIAEVRLVGDDKISCGIHPYFLRATGTRNEILTGSDIEVKITDRYEAIKQLVENKKHQTLEKVAQQLLVLQNNASPCSKWFCVDVEWARSFKDQEEKNSCMSSRMDIIAISKEVPHRVAVIELKYGSKSYDGNAGVIKHIQDFKTLKEGSIHDGNRIDYYDGLCTDICNILAAYDALDIQLPDTFKKISREQFAPWPEFYMMTLDNNAPTGGLLPKQAMASYLFSPSSSEYQAWDGRLTRPNVQDLSGINVLDASSQLPVTFVFSKQTITNLHVDDILEDESYEIIRPSFCEK